MQVTKRPLDFTSIDANLHVVKDRPADYNNNNSEKQSNKRVNLLKRIPLHRLMDLKIDYAFKQLFGNEKTNKSQLYF